MVGEIDGVFDGFKVGKLDGINDGDFDGEDDGLMVGDADGKVDGLIVGGVVGNIDGLIDGEDDGFVVGDVDNVDDGLEVGDFDGAIVVGAAEGPKVGPAVVAPLQVTVTYNFFTVPEHGSPNTVLVAESEQVARFKQALETTLTDVAALHDEVVYDPHEPPGVP